MARRLCHILRVLYYMIKKGISKHDLLMDFHHLLKRSKIAGKAIGDLLLAFHPHAGGQSFVSTLSCRTMDPNTAFYNPREVEFSCSNTPSFQFHRRKRHHHHHHHHKYDAAAVAKIFDILNSSSSDDDNWAITPSPSPSPAPMPIYGRSAVRQLRVTDSPFPVRGEEEEGCVDASVDMEAEEFIRRFYEQLVLQQRAAGPEIGTSSSGRRRVAGGGRGGGWSG